jgi:hypothetical protein
VITNGREDHHHSERRWKRSITDHRIARTASAGTG